MPTHTDQALPLLPNSGSCALSHLGVIAARGSDAAHFLHNQLTQDFVLLDMQHARLAAFCNFIVSENVLDTSIVITS